MNPNAKEGEASQRRNQIIEESKFLGGDIEHTHLVKGLDYALLHKVKAEIYNKENQDDDVEGIVTQKTPTIAGDAVKKAGMATGNAAEKLRGTAVCRYVLGGGKACQDTKHSQNRLSLILPFLRQTPSPALGSSPLLQPRPPDLPTRSPNRSWPKTFNGSFFSSYPK